jgi:predicted transglutaminase-like cysteine proteinase
MKTFHVALFFALSFSVVSAQSVSQSTPQTKEVEAFKKAQQERIQQNAANLLQLKSKKPSAQEKADTKNDKQIAALEFALNDLKKRLDIATYGNKESWEEFKRNYNHDMDELEKILADLFRDNS